MPIMTARCWHLKRRCEMWMVRKYSYPKGHSHGVCGEETESVRRLTRPHIAKPLGAEILFGPCKREKIQSLAMRYKEEKLFGNWVLIKSSVKSGLTCFPQSCLPTLHPGCARNAPKSRVWMPQQLQDFTLR